MYEDFVKDFKEQERAIEEDPQMGDKDREIEKREREEQKRMEKIFRKETTEVEDIFNDPSLKGEKGLKQLKERIAKTIAEISKI